MARSTSRSAGSNACGIGASGIPANTKAKNPASRRPGLRSWCIGGSDGAATCYLLPTASPRGAVRIPADRIELELPQSDTRVERSEPPPQRTLCVGFGGCLAGCAAFYRREPSQSHSLKRFRYRAYHAEFESSCARLLHVLWKPVDEESEERRDRRPDIRSSSLRRAEARLRVLSFPLCLLRRENGRADS